MTYAYSNFGYIVLGSIIEHVSGLDYSDFVRNNILTPAGIYRMQPGASLLSGRLTDEVKYYDCAGAALAGSLFPPLNSQVPVPYGGLPLELMLANGGWVASTMDLLRYADNLNGQLQPGILQSPPAGFVGYVPPAGSGWGWYFDGSLPGTSTILHLDTGYQVNGSVTWAVLFNTRQAGSPSPDILADADAQLLLAVQNSKSWPAGDLFPTYSGFASACRFTVPAIPGTMGASGGSGAVAVVATNYCAWKATSNAAWLTVTGGSTGSGNGNLTWSAAANPDSVQRTGSLTVAGQTFTVKQDGKSASMPPAFTVAVTHSGKFSQGQKNAQYAITVTNTGKGASSGAVTVLDTAPAGLTLVSMTGSGWTCPSGRTSCTRSDVLSAGKAWPAITVTVNVAAAATSPQINLAGVSGGGAVAAAGSDSTAVAQSPAAIAATGGASQSARAGASFAQPLMATVKDAGGHPVSGVTVTFTAPSVGASATLSSGTAMTNSSGVASVTATAKAVAGSYVVSARVNGVAGTAGFSLTNSAGAAASVAAAGGSPQSATVNAKFPQPLAVVVKDASGNPVSGVTVTFAGPSSGAGATMSSRTASTSAAGAASVTATANAVAGSCTIKASVNGVAAAAVFSLSNRAGLPASARMPAR